MISTIDRNQQPDLKEITHLHLPVANKYSLDNGIPLYTIDSGEKDIIKLELIFKAGKWYEPGKLISKFAATLMKEGTASSSAEEIAERFDFYGATLKVTSNAELGSLTVFCLRKHLEHILPVVHELLTEATYPEREFDIMRTNAKQKLLIQLEKNDFIASRTFLNVLYGDAHPFGYFIEPDDHDDVDPQHVRKFYRNYYTHSNCSMIVSGKIDDNATKVINQYLGNGLLPRETEIAEPSFNEQHLQEKIHYYEKEGSVQSALNIGKHLFNKTHPDYQKMSIVNTLLGGYFGSRLMSNIREQKGYTYGIYSGINSFLHGGHFVISTEVGSKHRTDTIREISREIQRLTNEPIPEVEFETVKNYMVAKILRSLDGPFNLSTTYKKLWIYGLDESFLTQQVDQIRTIEKDEVKALVEKHLAFDELYQIAVG